MNEVIKVENLSKIYNLYDNTMDRMKEALSISRKSYHKEFYALNNISFDVKKGEAVGIIGTNGSGKSTLLKIITGLLQPTQGNIYVDGKISALLELGAGFNPEYTGIENIYLNGMMMGYSRDEIASKIENIIKFAEIGDFINQPVKMYSSGMFARLAFAVAINVEPDILIVDEALSVGDVFFQNKCFRKFEELREKGVTILFVSHDIESVKQMCNRVLWIEKGEQIDFGETKRICNLYAKKLVLKNNELLGNKNLNNGEYKKKKFEIRDYPLIEYSKESIKNDDVKILSCFFENEFGEIIYDIQGGKKYSLSVVFETSVEIKKCIVGFVLQNKKGMSIINTNSVIGGEKKNFFVDANTINKVSFEFILPKLANDEYIVDCAVADGVSVMDNVMLTWVYGATRIFVSNRDSILGLLDTDMDIEIYSNKLQ